MHRSRVREDELKEVATTPGQRLERFVAGIKGEGRVGRGDILFQIGHFSAFLA